MTDEMLAIAEENKRKSGLPNVEFLKGEIENILLPDNTVDVIVSNCVINLSGDKDRVLQEASRVLKPGGRLAVSDVVVRGGVPAEIQKSMELWVGCVAGALSDRDYRQKLVAAGFEAIDIEATRVYNMDDARECLSAAGIDAEASAPKVQDKFISAFVHARSLRRPPPVAIQRVAKRESCGVRCWTHRACTVRLATLVKCGALE
jgi:arsenite methyltransferase